MKQAFQKYLKGSKKRLGEVELPPPPPLPRTTEEITKEYTDLCAKYGHTQYRIKLLEADLNEITNRIITLDREGQERRRLDTEAAAQQPKEEAKDVEVRQ